MVFPSKASEVAFRELVTEQMDDDIIVLGGLGRIPFHDYNLSTSFAVMTLVRRGWVSGRYRLRELTLKQGDLFVLTPGQCVTYEALSDDFEGIVIVLSEQFAANFKQVGQSAIRMQFLENGPIHLSGDELDFSIHAIETLRYLLRHKTTGYHRMVLHLIGLWFRVFRTFSAFRKQSVEQKTNSEYLFDRFYAAVDHHYCQSREVAFYAQQLCITPKYLSRVVKQVTGKTPLEWICERVIHGARVLLLDQNIRSLQQVSDQLGFSDYATFSKFFKKHTGETPSQFRSR